MEGLGRNNRGGGTAGNGVINPQISTYKDFNPKARPVERPWYSDGELKRRNRIAKYKYYSVEGKVKNSFNKGLRWLKKTCSIVVHGYK
ncbi:hypothetical protein ACP275_02G098300 [Erythranthe tilingii]